MFLTLVALARELRRRNFWSGARAEPDLLSLLHLVALGTVADVVPLKGLNRAFVAKGLIALRRRDHVGATALMDVARLSGPPEPWHLGFLLGPAHQCRRPHRPCRSRRAAAAGRRPDRSRAHRRRARPARTPSVGKSRSATLAQAEAEAMAALGLEEKGAVVVTAGEGWHAGVVGLVAARLKERYGRPAFAIALEPGGTGTGSGRSIAGVDLGRAVRRAVREGLLLKGGGHAMAAGVTLRKDALGRVPRLSRGGAGAVGRSGAARARADDRRRGQRRRRQSGAVRNAGARGPLWRRQSGADAGAAGAYARLRRPGG